VLQRPFVDGEASSRCFKAAPWNRGPASNGSPPPRMKRRTPKRAKRRTEDFVPAPFVTVMIKEDDPPSPEARAVTLRKAQLLLGDTNRNGPKWPVSTRPQEREPRHVEDSPRSSPRTPPHPPRPARLGRIVGARLPQQLPELLLNTLELSLAAVFIRDNG
jgi:hypothetical protein